MSTGQAGDPENLIALLYRIFGDKQRFEHFERFVLLLLLFAVLVVLPLLVAIVSAFRDYGAMPAVASVVASTVIALCTIAARRHRARRQQLTMDGAAAARATDVDYGDG